MCTFKIVFVSCDRSNKKKIPQIMSKEITSKTRPASAYQTTNREDAVKLRIGTDAVLSTEPLTLPHLVYRTATSYPDAPALKYKDEDNNWKTVTYSQYHKNVLKRATVFIKLGLEPKNTVAILAFNSPEWFYSDLAAIHAG